MQTWYKSTRERNQLGDIMFDPKKPVAPGQRAAYTARPTVIAFVAVAGIGGESLLMVLPQKADPQG